LVTTQPAASDIVAAEVGWQTYTLVAPIGTFPARAPYLGEVLRAMRDIRTGKRERIKYSQVTWKRAVKLLDAAQK
jgi:hypothetical protein